MRGTECQLWNEKSRDERQSTGDIVRGVGIVLDAAGGIYTHGKHSTMCRLVKSLWHAPEINVTWCVSCTSIKTEM